MASNASMFAFTQSTRSKAKVRSGASGSVSPV
jgi:hypothetical protein